ncbi:MAG: hypothetical protein RIB60_08630 [Phycisphaerales bacterium]
MTEDRIYDLAPEEPNRPAARIPAPRVPDGPPMPCPYCQYDLRGIVDAKTCPECGNRVSQTRIRAAREAKERKLHQQAWFPAAVTLAIGIIVTCAAFGYDGASSGDALLFMLVGGLMLTVSVIIGWVVYPVLAFMWIGWSSSIPTTALQLAGAYAGATATLAVMDLTGLPWIPQLLSGAVLIGLLCKLMDIDANDAVILAVISWAIKVLIAMLVVNAIIQSGA